MLLRKTLGCLLAMGMILGCLGGIAAAQETDADRAVKLLDSGITYYNNMEFVKARADLVKANELRDQLPADKATELDQYMGKATQAIREQDAGLKAFNDAEEALSKGELAAAQKLYAQVTGNEYVPAQVRKAARAQAALVADRLNDAGDPPVETLVVVETPAVAETPVVEAPVAPTDVQPTAPADPVDVAAPPADTANVEAARLVEAERLTAEGDKALAGGEAVKAMELYNEALGLANIPAARAGLEKARMQAPGGAVASGAMEELAEQRRRELDRARALIEQDIKAARELLQAPKRSADFDAAHRKANNAMAMLESGKSLFPADQFASKQEEIEGLSNWISDEKDDWEIEQMRIARDAAQKALKKAKALQENERNEKVKTLIANAEAEEKQGNYEAAVKLLDQVLNIEPYNAKAKQMRDQFWRFMIVMKQRKAFDDIDRETVEGFLDIEFTKIPWHQLLTLPEDWPELSRRREQSAVGYEYDSEANRAVRRVMGSTIPRINFTGLDFLRVIDQLRTISNANFTVDWNQLEMAGVDANTPVTLNLTNVSFKKALDLVLEKVTGASQLELGYVVDEGVITISTKEALQVKPIVRVYDIQDLTFRVPYFQSEDLNLLGDDQRDSGGSGGSGGGMWGDSGGSSRSSRSSSSRSGDSRYGDDDDDDDDDAPSREEVILNLLDMIRSTIAPDSWRTVGGTVGSITEMNGVIVVTQTAENHTALLGLLRQLRESRAIQVNIEARFISVSTGFLNDIGMNFDFFLNIGSTTTVATDPAATTYPSAALGTDPITGARILATPDAVATGMVGSGQAPAWVGRSTRGMGGRWTPIPVRMGSSGFSVPSETIVPGSIGGAATTSALSIVGSFLDDIQVDFLIRATQADQRTSTLSSPRITLFNASRGFVFVGSRQYYISDLRPVTSDNVALYDPDVQPIDSGTTLDVEATVSADRKYVTMTLRPRVQTLNGFQDFPLPGSGDVLRLPIETIQQVNTTVTVPDKATLLIGGQRLAGEVTREMGVPILSKIPILNRFFTSRSTVRDEFTLLILIKPTILIHKDIEDQQFP